MFLDSLMYNHYERNGENMEWKIKDVTINNQVVIAPMAGVTNIAYRSILKEFGAGLIYTEMISDKGLWHHNYKTIEMLEISSDEKPITLQLFGSEVDSIVEAAKFIDKNTNCDIIDINMGCPVSKVTKSGAGAALLQDENKVHNIVKSVVDSVNKPVTVKIRIGWNGETDNLISIAKAIEAAGASAIAVHGRTKSQMYSGKADWSSIKKVKDNISIPVIGNGDIQSPEDAKQMLEETGCDAVMIGRGILGNPWLIKQTIEYLDKGVYSKRIMLDDIKKTMYDHLERLEKLKGEKIAVLEMRSHGPWYLKGLKNASNAKKLLASATKISEVYNIIDSFFFEYEG